MSEVMEMAEIASTRYTIKTKVVDIKKVGPKWYVLFEGSWEFLGLDLEEPTLKVGDTVEIKIRKVANALPSQSPV